MIATGTVASTGLSERLAYGSIALLVVTITWNGVLVGGLALSYYLLAVTVVCVAIFVSKAWWRLSVPPWMFLAALGLALTALITMMFPPAPALLKSPLVAQLQPGPAVHLSRFRSDGVRLVQFELALTVLPLIVGAVVTDARRAIRLVDLWVLSVVASAIIAVAEQLGVPAPLYEFGARSSGLTAQPNHLGLTCAMALPIAMLWLTRSRRRKLAGAAAISILMAGVYAAGSRVGTVEAFCAVVITVAIVPRLRVALLPVLAVVGMAAVLLVLLTGLPSEVLSQSRLQAGSGVVESDRQRAIATDSAVASIRARPLTGVGFGVIDDAHNIYLQILAAGGLVGLASLAVYGLGVGASTMRSLGGGQRDLTLVLGMAELVWLTNGVFGNQLTDPYLYVLPSVLLALGGLHARTLAGTRPTRSPTGPADNVRAERGLLSGGIGGMAAGPAMPRQ